MIYEIDQPDGVRALFADLPFDRPFIDGALDGPHAARIFADHPTDPQAALMCRTYEYYLAGDPASLALRRFLADAPAEPGVFGRFYGYAVDRTWQVALSGVYGGRLKSIGRCYYVYGPETPPPYEAPHEGRIVPIGRKLAQRLDRGWYGGTLKAFWGSYSDFTAHGFGRCVMHRREPVSLAVTDAVSPATMAIGVETAKDYRRRGYATTACAALIDEALGRGLTPTWSCDAVNTASRRLAESLGFELVATFTQMSTPSLGPLTTSRGRWHTPDGRQWLPT